MDPRTPGYANMSFAGGGPVRYDPLADSRVNGAPTPFNGPTGRGMDPFSPGPDAVSSVREHMEEIEQLHKNNFNLKMKIFYLEEKLSRMNNPDYIDQMAKENVELKVAYDEKCKELQEQQKLLITVRSAVEQLQQRVGSAEATCRDAQNQHQQLLAEVNQHKQTVYETSVALRECEEKLEFRSEEVTKLKTDNQKLILDLDHYRRMAEPLHLRLQERDSEVAKLRGQVSGLDNDILRQRRKVSEYEHTIQEQLQVLQGQRMQTQQDFEILAKRCTEYERRLLEADSLIQQWRQRSETAEGKVVQLRQENDDQLKSMKKDMQTVQSSSAEKLKDTLIEIERIRESHRQNIERLESRVRDEEVNRARHSAEADALRAKIGDLEHQAKERERSTSVMHDDLIRELSSVHDQIAVMIGIEPSFHRTLASTNRIGSRADSRSLQASRRHRNSGDLDGRRRGGDSAGAYSGGFGKGGPGNRWAASRGGDSYEDDDDGGDGYGYGYGNINGNKNYNINGYGGSDRREDLAAEWDGGGGGGDDGVVIDVRRAGRSGITSAAQVISMAKSMFVPLISAIGNVRTAAESCVRSMSVKMKDTFDRLQKALSVRERQLDMLVRFHHQVVATVCDRMRSTTAHHKESLREQEALRDRYLRLQQEHDNLSNVFQRAKMSELENQKSHVQHAKEINAVQTERDTLFGEVRVLKQSLQEERARFEREFEFLRNNSSQSESSLTEKLKKLEQSNQLMSLELDEKRESLIQANNEVDRVRQENLILRSKTKSTGFGNQSNFHTGNPSSDPSSLDGLDGLMAADSALSAIGVGGGGAGNLSAARDLMMIEQFEIRLKDLTRLIARLDTQQFVQLKELIDETSSLQRNCKEIFTVRLEPALLFLQRSSGSLDDRLISSSNPMMGTLNQANAVSDVSNSFVHQMKLDTLIDEVRRLIRKNEQLVGSLHVCTEKQHAEIQEPKRQLQNLARQYEDDLKKLKIKYIQRYRHLEKLYKQAIDGLDLVHD